MYKFLWKLIRWIGKTDLSQIVALTDGSNDGNRLFANLIRELCKSTGDLYNKDYIPKIVALVQQAVQATLDEINRELGFKQQQGFEPKDLTALILDNDPQTRLRIASILQELILKSTSENKATMLTLDLGRHKTLQDTYFKEPRKKFFTAMCDWHFQLAIADILLGNYEDLDPIIGDQACEMRCPFLLDVISVVHKAAVSFKGEGEGLEYLSFLAKSVHQQGLSEPVDTSSTLKTKTILALLSKTHPDFETFCTLVTETLNILEGPTDGDFIGATQLAFQMSEAETREITITPFTTKAPRVASADASKKFSTTEYLRLCKTFTRNRQALMDEFGIDIDHESDLNFYDIAQQNPFCTVSSCSREASDFEKQMMSHHSTAYMKYQARELSKHSDKNLFGDISKVFTSCQAVINGSGYFMNMMPVYDAFRVILAHAAAKKHPIIVNLTRLKVLSLEKDREIELSSPIAFEHQKSWVLYFEPNDNGEFIYCSTPSSEQMALPGIAVVASSVFNPDVPCKVENVEGAEFVNAADPDVFFNGLIKCDIAHLLMWFGANHPTFPGGACIPTYCIPKFLPDCETFTFSPATAKTKKEDIIFRKPQKLGSNILNPSPEDFDCGRDYMRSFIYVSELNAPLERRPADSYKFSLLTMPCPLLTMVDSEQTLSWEYDYYMQLTLELGLDIEAVKYALMDGGRNAHEGDTHWERNTATLPFTPTHMYVTTYNTEFDHQKLMSDKFGDIVGSTIKKSTMFRKSQKYRIPDIQILLKDDDEETDEKNIGSNPEKNDGQD